MSKLRVMKVVQVIRHFENTYDASRLKLLIRFNNNQKRIIELNKDICSTILDSKKETFSYFSKYLGNEECYTFTDSILDKLTHMVEAVVEYGDHVSFHESYGDFKCSVSIIDLREDKLLLTIEKLDMDSDNYPMYSVSDKIQLIIDSCDIPYKTNQRLDDNVYFFEDCLIIGNVYITNIISQLMLEEYELILINKILRKMARYLKDQLGQEDVAKFWSK